MKTITINLYEFSELTPEAQQKAIQNLSDINTMFDWWESTYEDAKNIGLEITSFDLDRNRHAKGKFTLSANKVAENILKDHGKDCQTYKTAESFLNEYNPVFANYVNPDVENESSKLEDKLYDIISNFLKSLLEDYALILQKECDYLQSEEAIKETIEANEYTFTEDGKLKNA